MYKYKNEAYFFIKVHYGSYGAAVDVQRGSFVLRTCIH